MSILVIQSHRVPLPFDWLNTCMHSVRQWCDENTYEYQFFDDAIFELLPENIGVKYAGRQVVLSDLARLKAIQLFLNEGYERVVWLDADMLIFRSDLLVLPAFEELPEGYMLGREIWVQARPDNPNELQAHKKVHNAFLLFDQQNSFLDFYTEQAERMLSMAEQSIPPQFVGPKLLTALHNIIQCPVMESVGVLSPKVIADLLSQGQKNCALNLMLKRTTKSLVAANLCGSSVASGDLTNEQMNSLCRILLQQSVCL